MQSNSCVWLLTAIYSLHYNATWSFQHAWKEQSDPTVIPSENHKQTHDLKTQCHVRHPQLVRRALWFDSRLIRRLLIGSPGDWYEPSATPAVRCPTAQLIDGIIKV